MALINCPECGSKVSDVAESCPKCGYPINKKVTDTTQKESKSGCSGCLKGVLFAVLGCILLFIVLVICAGGGGQSNSSSKKYNENTTYHSTNINSVASSSLEESHQRESDRGETQLQDPTRKEQRKDHIKAYFDEILKSKRFTDIVGMWRIDLGGGLGYDNLILYYDDYRETFMLYSKSELEMNNPVDIIDTDDGWTIKLKKKWDDYYELNERGVLTMKSPGYKDASAKCIGKFDQELLY